MASEGVVIGSTQVIDAGSSTQVRQNRTPAGAIAVPYDRWTTLSVTVRRVDAGGVSQLVIDSATRDGVAVPGLTGLNVSAMSGYGANWLATGFNIGVLADDAAHGLRALLPEITVTKTSGAPTFVPGGPVSFTIQVENTGTADAANVTVSDVMPASLSSVTWTCSASGVVGAVCPTGSGTGDINEAIAALPVGGRLTYAVSATAPTNTVPTVITNSVSVDTELGVCAGDTDPPCTDSASLTAAPAASVPALGPWGLATLAAVLGAAGGWRRRSRTARQH